MGCHCLLQIVYTPKSCLKYSLDTFSFLPRIYLNFLVFFPNESGASASRPPRAHHTSIRFNFFLKSFIMKTKQNCPVVTSCNIQEKDALDLAPWVGVWGRGQPLVNHTAKSRG